MKPRKPSRNSHPQPPARLADFVAIVAGLSWTWAVALLATRHHLVGNYTTIPAAPWFWGFVALPVPLLLLILVAGAGMTWLCLAAAREDAGGPIPWAIYGLAATVVVPAMDLLRMYGTVVPVTFLEPLLVTAITGWAVGKMAVFMRVPASVKGRLDAVPWRAVVWGLAVLLAAWWYSQSVAAYDRFLLGFNDFGHFAQRVVNTWEGRGFLLETPSLPPFWDHFNPGLALLAPLWGVWPDARLFMLLQAVCLALPAPIVFGIVRRLHGSSLEAAAWAAAYLCYPAIGQMNLGYSYGWHPVSLALPLLFAAALLMLQGRRLWALAVVVLACSFREDVVVIVGCVAGAMALQGSRAAWRGETRSTAARETNVLARQLPVWGWFTVTAVLIVVFLLIFKFAGFSRFQVSRFESLGDTGWQIALSPLLRPRAFWGTVLQARAGYFLLALLVPLGLPSLFRGRWILLACALPVGVLLAWDHGPATSIAFQYSTTLIPVVFLAATIGARARRDSAGAENAAEPQAASLRSWKAAVTALAGAAAASLWLGALPWSQDTLTDVVGRTYADSGDIYRVEDRMPGSDGLAALHEAVALVDRPDASVLATGRIAAHLLRVRRIDTVGQARLRWAAFQEEVGQNRSPIELFDWIAVDTYERFQQSDEEIEFIRKQALQTGYRIALLEHGVVVLQRPEQ